MTIDRVANREPLSAKKQNRLIDTTNALANPGLAGRGQFGPTGREDEPNPSTFITLFELASGVAYPTATARPYTTDPTPWANARQVHCCQHNSGDVDGSGNPIRSYGVNASDTSVKIYFPTAPRNAEGFGVPITPSQNPYLTYDTPIAAEGDRVQCVFNRQSGRWEALPSPNYPRLSQPYKTGTLAAGLARTSRSASVTVGGQNTTAYNAFEDAAPAGSGVLLIPNESYNPTGSGDLQTCPWLIVRVTFFAISVCTDVGYSAATGAWTKSVRTLYCNAADDTANSTIVQGVECSSAVTLNGTTTSATASPSTVTYGQTVTLSGSTSYTTQNGSASASGFIAFASGSLFLGTVAVGASLPINTLPVGDHTITATYLGNAYYQQSSTTVSVHVNKADATVTVSVTSPSPYGATTPITATITPPSGSTAPTGYVIFDDTYNGTTITGAAQITVSAGADNTAVAVWIAPFLKAGTHSITAKFRSPNFNDCEGSHSVTISKKAAVVTPVATSRYYGLADPHFDWNLVGAVVGDPNTKYTGAPAVTSNSSLTSDAGSGYTITAAVGTLASDNYELTYATAGLTIVPYPMSITVDNTAKKKGEPNPNFTATIGGLKNADNITVAFSCGATVDSDVGTWSIVPQAVDSSPSKIGNYTVTLHNGTLTISA